MATATRAKPAPRLRYAVSGAARNPARKIILNGLMAYNRAHVGRQKWQPVSVVVKDAKGRVLGGLTGQSGWGWMYVELFWLPENLRRHGHGRELMALAEAEARKRGCIGLYLNTASFQAPGFYRKLGFRRYAVIDDFPPGHKTYFLVKRFKS